MFASAGAIASAGSAPEGSPSAAPELPDSYSCADARAQCTAECHDLSGGALSACLSICRLEYEECMGH
jgi:hypothetical protein